MYPILFSLFGRAVSGYWAAVLLGLGAGYGFVCFCNRKRLSLVHIHNLFCLIVLSACVAGLFAPSFYGCAFVTTLAFLGYIRWQGLDMGAVIWLFAPACPLVMVFVRLGCFLGGCCYGVPVSWGVTFPEGSLAPAGIALFPSQLAEILVQGLLFLLLLRLRRRGCRPMALVWAYAGGYGAARFVLEFFRGDALRAAGGLTPGQWLSLGAVLTAGIYGIFLKKRGASYVR